MSLHSSRTLRKTQHSTGQEIHYVSQSYQNCARSLLGRQSLLWLAAGFQPFPLLSIESLGS